MDNLYNLIILILVIIIILIISNRQCYTINTNSNNKNAVKEAFSNKNQIINNTKKYIYLFYSTDCKHSIDFIPTWETLKTLKDYSNLVEFRDVEASNDINDDFIKYNIKKMPTILIQNENEQDFTVYKGTRTLDDLVYFLKIKTGINLNKDDLEGFSSSIISPNFSFDNKTQEYKMETPTYIQTIKADFNRTHPLFSLIVSFLHFHRNSKDEPLETKLDLLKLKSNKDFLKCNEKGICNEIEKLKELYKENDEMINLINLIEEEVCLDNTALI